jgi:hypothetical protein
MLNNIFDKYTNKNKLSDKNPSQDKKHEEKLDSFLNEEENLTMKSKSDEIMKKYCNLYDEEDDPSNKYNIKPLNFKYNEHKVRKLENAKTTGKGWFDMRAPELTPELREDLKAIQLRHIIDPSRFYKKLDREALPKFFQVGKILDNIIEGKKNRLKKSEVKQRLAEEFLETDIVKSYSLRKFEELQGERRKLGLKKNKLNKYKMQNRKKARKSEYVPK